mmetsp:Transcript_13458/g.42947  ORF Transcript_13458/g.42947 Transcript_13458/m.42947 type:complete len:225 (+) Transcript_13458:141-815(+)
MECQTHPTCACLTRRASSRRHHGPRRGRHGPEARPSNRLARPRKARLRRGGGESAEWTQSAVRACMRGCVRVSVVGWLDRRISREKEEEQDKTAKRKEHLGHGGRLFLLRCQPPLRGSSSKGVKLKAKQRRKESNSCPELDLRTMGVARSRLRDLRTSSTRTIWHRRVTLVAGISPLLASPVDGNHIFPCNTSLADWALALAGIQPPIDAGPTEKVTTLCNDGR